MHYFSRDNDLCIREHYDVRLNPLFSTYAIPDTEAEAFYTGTQP